ncbi:MAG: hypothetical protein ACRCWQ_00135, partial [Bacilli bacterium]
GIPKSAINDSWFVGYTPEFTMSAWTGFDKVNGSQYQRNSDQSIVKYIFKQMMIEASKNTKDTRFVKPSSVVELKVIKNSDPAIIAGSGISSEFTTSELFVRGKEPSEKRDEMPKLPSPSNVIASVDKTNTKLTLDWDYNFGAVDLNGFPLSADQIKAAKVLIEVTLTDSSGNKKVIARMKNDSIVTTKVTPGETYKYEVYAVLDGTSVRSEIVGGNIAVPGNEIPPIIPPTDGDGEDGDGDDGDDNGNTDGDGDGEPDDGSSPVPPATTPPSGNSSSNKPSKPNKP